MSYLMKLFHDSLSPNSEVTPGLEAQHSILYIWKGSASINGKLVEADSAVYCEDFATIKAGQEGATLWRWELVPETDPFHFLKGEGVSSILRMSRKIKMFELVPTSKWLFRLDSIIGFEATTGKHANPGSGIRCLLYGHMRAESEKGECSESSNPGDCWYEEGAYPLVSTAIGGVKTTFLRGMVLTPEFANNKLSFSGAIYIDGPRVSTSKYKNYVEKIITLR